MIVFACFGVFVYSVCTGALVLLFCFVGRRFGYLAG